MDKYLFFSQYARSIQIDIAGCFILNEISAVRLSQYLNFQLKGCFVCPIVNFNFHTTRT